MIEHIFGALDQLDTTDLGPEVDRRRRSPEEPREIPSPPGRGRRVTAALVAVAVFAAAAGLGIRAWTRHQDVRPASEPWAWAGEGWTRIADPPQRLDGVAWVWAGGRLLAWGGCIGHSACSPTSGGFSYDPETRAWTSMPPAPRAGHDSVTVATADRAYFFGEGGVGQVFDVTTNRWSELPDAPIHPETAIWTGSEVVALQGAAADRGSAAASFDPRIGTWQLLPAPPIQFNVVSAVWSGHEMVVLGALLDERKVPARPTAEAMTLDPSTRIWRTLAPSGLYPGSFASAWLGDRLIAWSYEMKWQSLDPATGEWSDTRRMPLSPSECYVDGATVGPVAFAWNCGTAATSSGQTWTEVRGGPLDEMVSSAGPGSDLSLWRFATPVPAGDVLVLPMTGITVASSGEPCYGCSGFPESLWLYRPPSAPATETEAASATT